MPQVSLVLSRNIKKTSKNVLIVVLCVFLFMFVLSQCSLSMFFFIFFFTFTLNLEYSGSVFVEKEHDTSKPAHIILPCTKPHYVLNTYSTVGYIFQ